MRSWLLAALLFTALVSAQGPGTAPPAPAADSPQPTRTALPDLGPTAPLPDNAPPLLTHIDRDGLRTHAYWLADDARQGRYTSSKGQQATARYVADCFQQLGLKPLGDKRTFLQRYPLQQTALDPATGLQFGSEKIDTGYAVLPAGDGDKVQLQGRFVVCGKGRPDEIPAQLKGRIPVVVFGAVPRGGGGPGGDLQAIQRYFDLARQLAKSEASAGVVVLPGDPGSFGNALNYQALLPDHPRLSFGGGGGGGGGARAAVPLLIVGGPSAARLLAHLGLDGAGGGTADERASGRLKIVVKTDDKGGANNVVAMLEGGSRKAEAVVFSAHHDHIGQRVDGDAFNGADDNASGTAGLLEIAQAFALADARPTRSIVFLSVSGEELGLWGSQWFSDHPTWPLDKIVADVNIDMIGRAVADGEQTKIQVTPSKDHEAYSSLVRDAVQPAQALGISFTSGDAYYHRSDHYNFARKGVPVVFFCDGEHPDYHQVTDHADRLDYPRMEQIARLAAWTGWLAAERKERPKPLGAQASW